MTGTVELDAAQETAWTAAQALWGVHMHVAVLSPNAHEQSFAWFSFPPTVNVDLVEAQRDGVDGELETIFAHEIGHHVLSPSTRINSLKLTHQMGRALTASSATEVPNIPALSSFLSNVWSDMLINVRVAELQRRAAETSATEPGMIRMWRILTRKPTPDLGWWVVLRAYEDLWSLAPGALATSTPPPDIRNPVVVGEGEEVPPTTPAGLMDEFAELVVTNPEVDAGLLADTVRTFGADPVRGALRFGMILAPYLIQKRVDEPENGRSCAGYLGSAPATAEELGQIMRDARLREVPRHPLDDGEPAPSSTSGTVVGGPHGQGFGLAETLALYGASDHAAVLEAWYLAEAAGWVRPYREPAPKSQAAGTLPGPLDVWSMDDELADVDWPATLTVTPEPIPGVTTRLRTSFEDETPLSTQGIRLDLYIDSSGSMPSPVQESPAVLAGAILVLSVLRGGGQVRVTSFSGAGQVAGNERFTRDRSAAMSMLTTFFAGSTTFPLDLLAARYPAGSKRASTRSHLVVLSDDGLRSMFGEGQPQFAGVAKSARQQLDSATLIVLDFGHAMSAVAAENGYRIDYLETMADAPLACARLAGEIASFAPPRAMTEARHG